MTLKIGTLEADITANTAPLDQAEKVWRAKSQDLGNSFDTAGKRVGTQFQRIQGGAARMAASFRPVKGAVQQAAFQVQDFSVQLASGTNGMIAFSQQAPQLLGAFGPGGAIIGAIVGVGAAIGASLLPALFRGKDAIDELASAAEELDEVLRDAARDGGVVLLTDKIIKLAKESEQAARVELRGGIVTAMEAIDAAAEAAGNRVGDVFSGTFLSGARMAMGETTAIAQRLGVTTQRVDDLRQAMITMGRDGSPASLQSVQNQLDAIIDESPDASAELIRLATDFREISSGATRASERLEVLTRFEKDLTDAVSESTKVLDDNIKAQGKRVSAGNVVAEMMRRLREEAVKQKKIGALDLLGETDLERINRRAQELRDFVLEQDQLTADRRSELLAKIRTQQLAEIEEHGRKEREAEAKTRTTIDRLGESPLDRINREAAELREAVLAQEQLTADRRSELMAKIRANQIAETNEHNERLLETERAAQERRTQQEEAAAQRMAATRAAQQSAALQGLSVLGDAANDILSQTGQEGTAIAKAIFLAQKAIQVATIIAATEVAAANAAAVGAISGPIGFFTTASAIRAAGYTSAALVGGLAVGETFGGGRQFGGTVSPQLAHPINEAGTPEILNTAGRQYLLPTGKGGTITPMSSASGGGGQPNITLINNGTPQTIDSVSVTHDEVMIIASDAARQAEGRINASLATGRGDTARSLQRGFRSTRNLG